MQSERKVVREYATSLDDLAHNGAKVFDSARLPCSKAEIRSAILSLLGTSPPAQVKVLGEMLLKLADFQEGVGDVPRDPASLDPGGIPWSALVESERKTLESDLLKRISLNDPAPARPTETGSAACWETSGAGPAPKAQLHFDKPRLEQAERILAAYGKILQYPRSEGPALDASLLPYPKTAIREAILELLESATDSGRKEALESAFMKLADFQEIGAGAAHGKGRAEQVRTEQFSLSISLLGAGHSIDSGRNRWVFERVLTAYGKTLDASPARMGTIDGSELPYSKEVIGKAILELLEGADTTRQEALKSAFLRLAEFQEGAGGEAGESSRRSSIERMMAERQSRAVSLLDAGYSVQEAERLRSEHVVAAYGPALDSFPPRMEAIDASELPYSKETIGRAILQLLREAEDAAQQEALKSAFVRLADFQEGAGGDPGETVRRVSIERMMAERQSRAVSLLDAGYGVQDREAERMHSEQVIARYGQALERLEHAHKDGAIADISQLPYPKVTIKEAIFRLRDSPGGAGQSALFEFAYLRLADFQHGVGEHPVDASKPKHAELLKMVETERETLNAELKAAAGSRGWKPEI